MPDPADDTPLCYDCAEPALNPEPPTPTSTPTPTPTTLDGEGLHVMSCGHQVHRDCFDRYHAAVLGGGSEQLAQRLQTGLA